MDRKCFGIDFCTGVDSDRIIALIHQPESYQIDDGRFLCASSGKESNPLEENFFYLYEKNRGMISKKWIRALFRAINPQLTGTKPYTIINRNNHEICHGLGEKSDVKLIYGHIEKADLLWKTRSLAYTVFAFYNQNYPGRIAHVNQARFEFPALETKLKNTRLSL